MILRQDEEVAVVVLFLSCVTDTVAAAVVAVLVMETVLPEIVLTPAVRTGETDTRARPAAQAEPLFICDPRTPKSETPGSLQQLVRLGPAEQHHASLSQR